MLADYGWPLLNASFLIDAILIFLLASSAITDIWKQKIYNVQTYSAMACALLLHYVAGGGHEAFNSFLGLLTGFALLFIFYLVGGVGAGDVKLLAAIGALKGVYFVLGTIFYCALVGGIMAFAVIIWKRRFWVTLHNCWRFVRHPLNPQLVDNEAGSQYLPYGLAISVGGFWTYIAF